jgi:cytochrome c-type biogenesis protein CcmH/NrfG
VRLFTFWRAQVSYWRLLVLPFPLFMERSLNWATSLRAPGVWLGAVGSLSSLLVAVLAWRRRPLLSFAIGWFWLTFFPFSNLIVPINGILYEHFMYLPMVGIWLGAVAVAEIIVDRWPTTRQIWYGAGAFAIVLFSLLSIARIQEWHDPITFYLANLRYTPNSYRIVNNLGMAYADQGDWEAAKVMYERAVRLDPKNAVAWHNLGNVEVNHGSTTSAEQYFQQALALQPDFAFSRRALTQLYLTGNNYAAALPMLMELAKQSPQDVELWTVLMKVAAAQRDWSTAESALTHLRQLQPSNLQWWQAQQELEKLKLTTTK